MTFAFVSLLIAVAPHPLPPTVPPLPPEPPGFCADITVLLSDERLEARLWAYHHAVDVFCAHLALRFADSLLYEEDGDETNEVKLLFLADQYWPSMRAKVAALVLEDTPWRYAFLYRGAPYVLLDETLLIRIALEPSTGEMRRLFTGLDRENSPQRDAAWFEFQLKVIGSGYGNEWQLRQRQDRVLTAYRAAPEKLVSRFVARVVRGAWPNWPDARAFAAEWYEAHPPSARRRATRRGSSGAARSDCALHCKHR